LGRVIEGGVYPKSMDPPSRYEVEISRQRELVKDEGGELRREGEECRIARGRASEE
jgi:hypothetical protein